MPDGSLRRPAKRAPSPSRLFYFPAPILTLVTCNWYEWGSACSSGHPCDQASAAEFGKGVRQWWPFCALGLTFPFTCCSALHSEGRDGQLQLTAARHPWACHMTRPHPCAYIGVMHDPCCCATQRNADRGVCPRLPRLILVCAPGALV
jgi:hypothetical protein